MANTKLAQIARQLNRAKKPVAETTSTPGDLADAIGQLIQQQVEERVSAELDKQDCTPRNPRLRQLLRQPSPPMATDFKELPPTAKTPLPTMHGAVITRGEDGRAVMVNIGANSLRVERDSLGRILRLVPADVIPPQPAAEPAKLASARQYPKPPQ